ncbi:MAG: hypothetical protein EBU84_06725, partial [Actinobacteria bacterium]|nr:hypothetical protein [Actinomycetota bacterium]
MSTPFNKTLFKRALENENNAVISTLNTRKITANKLHQLQDLGLDLAVLQDYMTKLKDYRHVDDLQGLTHGSYIRWIDLKHPEQLSLARGAIICDIKIGQKGILLLCKTHPNPAVFHVSMDECLIFQRLSQQERVILTAMDYLDANADDDTDTDADDDTDTDADDDTD